MKIIQNKSSDIKVSIIYMTFNAEEYIADAIESFLMQDTNFNYEIVIHDDASSDNSQSILLEYQKKYPDIITLILQSENQHSKHHWPDEIILNYCKGEYIACCDGDDFWCDKNKLQIQADFMDAHSDYSLCTHATQLANEQGIYLTNKFMRPYTHDVDVPVSDMLSRWLFATCSLMFRSNIRGNEHLEFRGDCINNDFALTSYLAIKGKVRYIDKVMCVYRTQAKNSTNIRYKSLNKLTDQNEKFYNMIERFDKYTNYQFSKILHKQKQNIAYGTLLKYNNFFTATKSNLYKHLTLINKIKLKIKLDIFPFLNNRKNMWD